MSIAATLLTPRAVNIQLTLGTRRAAGFLRNRGVSLEDALRVLIGRA